MFDFLYQSSTLHTYMIMHIDKHKNEHQKYSMNKPTAMEKERNRRRKRLKQHRLSRRYAR